MADNLDWKDISTEAWREYQFPNGAVVRINNPSEVAVKRGQNGDSHRIKAFAYEANVAIPISHYIPPGWVRLSWTGKDGTHDYRF